MFHWEVPLVRRGTVVVPRRSVGAHDDSFQIIFSVFCLILDIIPKSDFCQGIYSVKLGQAIRNYDGDSV